MAKKAKKAGSTLTSAVQLKLLYQVTMVAEVVVMVVEEVVVVDVEEAEVGVDLYGLV